MQNMTRRDDRNGLSIEEPWFLDEPWIDARERPANKEVESLVSWPVEQRLRDPSGYIEALRSAQCRLLHKSPHEKSHCQLPIVVKLFDVHYASSALRSATASMLRPWFSDPNTRVVVLERDPLAQRCSLIWAEHTNHWWLPDTPGSLRRAYEAFKHNNCSHAGMTSEGKAFVEEHEKWFATIHEALRMAPGASRRSINASYDANVNHHSALLARIQKELLAAA